MASVMRFDEWQDSNGVPVLDGAGGGLALGKILQVVQTVKSDTFSSSATGYTAITGFNVVVTPSATSSKVLVTVDMNMSGAGNGVIIIKLLRNGTPIYVGDTAGSRTPALMRMDTATGITTGGGYRMGGTFLDSPSTTSAVTYSVEVARTDTTSGTPTFFLNRSGNSDSDLATIHRAASSITAMEVAG